MNLMTKIRISQSFKYIISKHVRSEAFLSVISVSTKDYFFGVRIKFCNFPPELPRPLFLPFLIAMLTVPLF